MIETSRFSKTVVRLAVVAALALSCLPACPPPASAAEPQVRIVVPSMDGMVRRNKTFMIGDSGDGDVVEARVTGADDEGASFAWEFADGGIAQVDDASARRVTVTCADAREGWTTLRLTATLSDGTELSDETVYAACTPVEAAATAIDDAELTRGPSRETASFGGAVSPSPARS